ncbi:MAG: hypothetical protein AB7G88_05675 [Thermomicrobiales bacterium]
MSTVRQTRMLAHNGRNLVDWLTGTGLLTLNALFFFGALVVLVPWNVYSSPGNFWSADTLIPWAFLLGFHALLVGTWNLIRNVILKDTNPVAEMTPTARQWHSARARSMASAIDFRSRPVHGGAADTASTLYAEEWARQNHNHANNPSFDAEPMPVEPPSPQQDALSGMNDLLADWDTSWPDPLDSVGKTTPHVSASPAPTNEGEMPVAGQMITERASRSPGPLTAAARASSGGDPNVDPELEWQWLEAAATAWLSRREQDASISGSDGTARH